jgi:hypothetical protein
MDTLGRDGFERGDSKIFRVLGDAKAGQLPYDTSV